MNRRIAFVVAALVLAGCAPYKQLKPKEPLTPKEQGYIELERKEDKNFKLKKKKKYYIQFPAPNQDHFYLVLDLPQKEKFNSFLSDTYEDKKVGKKIPDESAAPDTQSAYPIDKSATAYYWFIENGEEDVELKVKYRYTPQWRYKFEDKHLEYKAALKDNKVDRKIYKALGTSYHFDNSFDFPGAMREVTGKSAELEKVHKQLLELESIFPPDIVDSKDKAYLDFKGLKKKLEEEMAFQDNYLAVLKFFDAAMATSGNAGDLVTRAPVFLDLYKRKEKLPKGVLDESRAVLGTRLKEVPAYYDRLFAAKDDASPLDSTRFRLESFALLDSVYELSGMSRPAEFTALYKFVTDFQQKSQAIARIKQGFKELDKAIAASKAMPSNTFFDPIVKKAEELKSRVPSKFGSEYGKYARYMCAGALNRVIDGLRGEVESRVQKYHMARGLVPQLNALKAQRDYRGMLGILKQYPHLGFLQNMYTGLDRMSLDEQVRLIRDAIENYHWAKAERRLSELHRDNTFLNPQAILQPKRRAVQELEQDLIKGINTISRSRVQKFLKENVDSIQNVDSLYTDSVWTPAYRLTFTTGNRADLARRNQELAGYLTRLKEDEFPRRAIKLLYDRFMKNPHDNGVQLARAIVAHGKHYTGDDRKTKRRIAEVDPFSSKWIVKPKQYRRVFVVPITDKKRGSNRYFFRLNIRIPTEAKFPVYDVTVKLPKGVAANAGSEKWYEKMSLNDKPLKNEGRFRITAPTAENNYECQIGPVRMKPDFNNKLDIFFWHPSYKIHTVSVMVQKPIIKKH